MALLGSDDPSDDEFGQEIEENKTIRCRKCDKRIVYIRMKSGRRRPVDADGWRYFENSAITKIVTENGWFVNPRRSKVRANSMVYNCHWMTCSPKEKSKKKEEGKCQIQKKIF